VVGLNEGTSLFEQQLGLRYVQILESCHAQGRVSVQTRKANRQVAPTARFESQVLPEVTQ